MKTTVNGIPSLCMVSILTASCRGFSNIPPVQFDRFVATCPADISCIRQFDSQLVEHPIDPEDTWVAIYRSNNNLPSVIRDDFFDAMKVATTVIPPASQVPVEGIEIGDGVTQRKPVAVGRLKKNDLVGGDKWLIDCLRCTLKKEEQSEACDGGSEHTEALCVCIDELLLQYLKLDNVTWESAIRCKATLVSGKLVAARGFGEVEALNSDMATHVSKSVNSALEQYALRVVETTGQTLERTLNIVNLLGKIDQTIDGDSNEESSEDDAYDPWASVKKYI